jgi:hypothetical protein
VGVGAAAGAMTGVSKPATSMFAKECARSQVRVRTTTSQRSYAPGTVVLMTTTARNASASTCDIATGAISPSFVVTSSKGAEVWNNCDINDRPGACPMYVILTVALKPGQQFVRTVHWDQRSGEVPVQVASGTYTVTAQFSGAASSRARFTITG